MKRKLLLSLFSALALFSKAQVTFSDDFENYTVGSALGPQSATWTTWSGAQGGADDINVGNTDAHSGTNSLYFTSTTATGGPSDIVLPLGGVYNTGNLVYANYMKVATNKKAYFNFQGTNTMGQTYTMNFTFNTDGTLNVDDASSLTLQTTYPQNAWFELRLNAKLNSNEWELFIDNVSKGKFQNSVYNVAALDYYSSDNTNSFWIDDVSFSYTPFVTPTLNGAISILGIDNGIVTQQRTPSITFRNLGTTAINSCTVEVNANGNITSQNLTGLNVAPGAAYSFTYANAVTLIAGLNTFTATIKSVNGATTDDYPLDDQKTINFTPVVPGADKLVIGEEATGTWCQWCPRGAVGLRNMDKKYHGFFQGIAVHNNDPMEVPVYDSAFGTLISGYPSGSVDRGADVDPGSFEGDFLQRIVLTPKAKIKNGASYNSSTGQLDVSLTTEFKTAATGNYRILCVIVEDSVKGTGSGYNQSNAYANNSNGPMGGFESLPNPVPAAQMVYDHVARAIAPGFGGIQNAYPSSVVAGSSYVHNMSFNISAWDKNKIAIVGILLAPDGRIENASSTTIDEAAANGYVVKTNDIVYNAADMNLYPNPTQGVSELLIQTTTSEMATVRLLDINGRLIVSKEVKLFNGSNRLPIVTNTLANGMYVVEVSKSGTTSTLKLIKE